LGERGCVDRVDMCARGPAISDNSDIELFHGVDARFDVAMVVGWQRVSRGMSNQSARCGLGFDPGLC
jgi:hypothetical protein